MLKIAILNSYNFNFNKPLKESICEYLAGPDNIGNLVYLEYIKTKFKVCDSISSENILSNPKWFKETYDLLIVPFSNMLSEYFSSPLVPILEDYDIKILLISIGVQAPLESSISSISLSKDAVRLLKQASASNTPIGVRGVISKSVVEKYGFSATVVGCPSVFGSRIDLLENKNTFKENLVGNCTFSGHHKNLTASLVTFILKKCNGYALQDESRIIRDVFDIELADIPFTTYNETAYSKDLANKLFDYGYYNDGVFSWGQIREFFRKNAFFTLTIDDWKAYLSNFTCSIGMRFHGNTLAMHAGTPAIYIPCDLRTSELVSYHKLPSIDHPNEYCSIDENVFKSKIKNFSDNLDIAYREYLMFLEEAGVLENWIV
jgi:hypothetical protein